MSQRKLGLFVSMVIGSAAMIACGGGGGSGSPAADFDSVEDLAAAMDAPTGTVDATTAKPVADEFQAFSENGGGLSALAGGFAGVRQKAQAASASEDCSGGGSISVDTDEQTYMEYSFNSCVESDCTIDGGFQYFIGASGSYSACFVFDLSVQCAEESASAAGSYCQNGETGVVEYLIAVNGETYTVSGYYSNGTGELTIRGANGTYTCTYTDGAGSCVDEAGSEFTF